MGRRFRVGHPFPRSLTLLQLFQIKEILQTSDLRPRAATLVFREERQMPASSAPGLRILRRRRFRSSPTITASASHAADPWRGTTPPAEPGHVVPAIAPRAAAIVPTARLSIAEC